MEGERGLILATLGRLEEARDALHRAVALKRRIGALRDESVSWFNLALVEVELGEWDRAWSMAERAAELAGAHGPGILVPCAEALRAVVAARTGRPVQAIPPPPAGRWGRFVSACAVVVDVLVDPVGARRPPRTSGRSCGPGWAVSWA